MVEPKDFWDGLDWLLAECRLVIDRPRGSAHPRYPDLIYPMDYGYLEGSTGGDGAEIDVWLGSLRPAGLVGVALTVDLHKRDAEIKLLLGCTEEEKNIISSFPGGNREQSTLKVTLVERSSGTSCLPETAWAKEIAQRVSVRRFTEQPVPVSILQRILQAAVAAPSAHNRQPWRFVILREHHTREVLAETLAVSFRKDLSEDGRTQEQVAAQVQRSYERITQAPAAILVCLETGVLDHYPDARRQGYERQIAVQSVAMAGENLLLAAAGEGLGGVWMCAPLFAPEAARNALDLPVSWEPQGLVLVGYPALSGEAASRRTRLPLAEVTRWK